MALKRFLVQVQDVQLVAGAAQTILGLRGGTDSVSINEAPIIEIGVSFDGSDVTHRPVLVELTNFTWTGANLTVIPAANISSLDDDDAPSTFNDGGKTWTVEPARNPNNADAGIYSWRVSPAGGVLIKEWEEGKGPTVNGANRFYGIRCKADDAVKVTAYIMFRG